MRVLIVDDEKTLHAMITDMLRRVDPTVVVEAVDNGDDALTRYVDSGPYDLVITDHNHSGLTGVELVEAIHGRNGAQAIVLQSGNFAAHADAFRRVHKTVPVLFKPYSAQQLQHVVQAAINLPTASDPRIPRI